MEQQQQHTQTVQRHNGYPFSLCACISLNAFFFSLAVIDIVCIQNEMRQKAVDSLYTIHYNQRDRYICIYVRILKSIAQIERVCCFYLVLSHRRRRCGILN